VNFTHRTAQFLYLKDSEHANINSSFWMKVGCEAKTFVSLKYEHEMTFIE